MVSPFDILLIDEDADPETIEQAYRRRVKETHPDQGGSAREFQLVQSAYEEITSERSHSALDGPRKQTHPEDLQQQSTVEYLNYEVLDDYGWSLEDEDLFDNAATADLGTPDYGRFLVEPGESLLEAAENRGFTWPYSCRGGACANCAVAVTDGELSLPINHVLPEELTDRGIRLSCVGAPITDDIQVVYNIKHMPALDELRLPPRPFDGAHSSD